MITVNNNASEEEVNAVHAIEKFWKCPECPKEFEEQDPALEHHIEEHQ